MFGGRIEMPLEEFNAMKSKIDEFEKVLNSISGETAKYKEENEELKEFLDEIRSMSALDRLTSWYKLNSKFDKFLKVE
jgi:hypothetical protein